MQQAIRAALSGLSALWQARRSPFRWRRVTWWLVLIALILLVISGPGRPQVFWTLWLLLNGSLAVTCGAWGLFHLRSVLKALPIIRHIALLMAILAGFLLLALQDIIVASFPQVILSSSALLIGALLVFPLAYPVCWLLGALGASIGAFGGRFEPDPSHSARYGVAGWWLAMWNGGILLAQGAPEWFAAFVWCGAPVLACLAALAAPKVRVDDVGLVHRLTQFLDKRLRVPLRGGKHVLDLRGAFLGMAAGLLLLVSGLMGVFSPVQARLLASLVEFRSAALLTAIPGMSLGRLLDEGRSRNQTSEIIVLRMDGETRRDILRSGSEAATQSAILHLLLRYEPRLIVLPAPLLDPEWQTNLQATYETPHADAATIARSLRDLPELEEAIQQAGNVVFSLSDLRLASTRLSDRPSPPLQHSAELQELARAARKVGYADLENLDGAWLPAITLHWERLQLDGGDPRELPPLPVVLYAERQKIALPSRDHETSARSFRLGERTFPLTGPGSILVSYFAGEPNMAFATLDYHTILESESDTRLPMPSILMDRETLEPKTQVQTRWVHLEDLFRGKIVFLDGLDPHLRQTPIGKMSEPELMAHATMTLLTGSIVHRLLTRPIQQVLLTSLALAGLIGHLTLGRAPLRAGVLVGLVASGFIIICLVWFLFGRIWIDPLLPLLAGVAAYLLVVQYASVVDKWEVSRNRELLERYLGREAVSQFMENDYVIELGGVQLPICVLFADIRGFSRYASEHSPEEVVDTVNRYLAAMDAQVDKYEGMLDKFLGDGMLAIFGFPQPREDDVLRAVQAAMAMQEEATRISAELTREGRQPLGLGIGMHYGEAIVGLMGSERCPDLTAIGYTVVLGQRLQGTAQPGEIVLSEALCERLAGAVEAVPRPPEQVKGFPEPVRSYRLLSLRLLEPPMNADERR